MRPSSLMRCDSDPNHLEVNALIFCNISTPRAELSQEQISHYVRIYLGCPGALLVMFPKGPRNHPKVPLKRSRRSFYW